MRNKMSELLEQAKKDSYKLPIGVKKEYTAEMFTQDMQLPEAWKAFYKENK